MFKVKESQSCEVRTMSSLARQIEEYIKALLAQESAGVVELQRNMLSEYFHCVP